LRWKTKVYKKMYGDEFSVARGAPVSRYGRRWKPSFNYFSPERFDEEFMASRKAWAIARGLPTWYYTYY
jgi:hypothetical protein